MNKKKLTSEDKFQIFGHLILAVYTVICLLPFVLLFVSSITDNSYIIAHGYSLLPKKFSLSAYIYLLQEGKQIFRAYGMTLIVTGIGTFVSLFMTIMLAYTISRKDLPGRGIISFCIFFTMLFNGGLVPTYLLYQSIGIKNTIFALIVPTLLMNGFNVMIARSFLQSNIPAALIEAAEIDGAGEFKIFFKIVLSLAKPILATIGLFSGIAYWNDWMNGLYYLTDPKLFTIQNILNKIISDAQFLANNSTMASQVGNAAANIPTTTVRMAIAFVGMVPIMLIYPFAQKYFIKGIALGAVKG